MLKNTKYIIWSIIFLFFLILIPNDSVHAQVASVDLRVNGSNGPVSIIGDTLFVLSWDGQYVDSCTGTNFETSGAGEGFITASTSAYTIYTITCVSSLDSNNNTDPDSVTVSKAVYNPGSCGPADGKNSFNEPLYDDLCSVGNASTVETDDGLFSWRCINGGYGDNDLNDLVVEVTVSCTGDLSTDNYLDETPNEFWSIGEIDLQNLLDINYPGSGIDKENDQLEAQSWVCDGDTSLNIKFISKYAGRQSVFGYYTNEDPNSFMPVFRTGDVSSADEDIPVATTGAVFYRDLGQVSSFGFGVNSWAEPNYINYKTNSSLSKKGWDSFAVYNPSVGIYFMGVEDIGGPSSGPLCSTVDLPGLPPLDAYCGTGNNGYFASAPSTPSVLCDTSIDSTLDGSVATTTLSGMDYWDWDCAVTDYSGTTATSSCQAYIRPECGSPQYECNRGVVIDSSKEILDNKIFQWSCLYDYPPTSDGNDNEKSGGSCEYTCPNNLVAIGDTCQNVGQIKILKFEPTQRIINKGDTCTLNWEVEITELSDQYATSTCSISGNSGYNYSVNYEGIVTITGSDSNEDVQSSTDYYLNCKINEVVQSVNITNVSSSTSCILNPSFLEI